MPKTVIVGTEEQQGKQCCRCRNFKPSTDYYTITKNGKKCIHSYCKSCSSDIAKEKRIKDPESTRQARQRWLESGDNREKARQSNIKWELKNRPKKGTRRQSKVDDFCTFKKCTKCEKVLPVDQFHKRRLVSKVVPTSFCKSCKRESIRRFTEQNPDRIKASRAKWKISNKDKYRASENSRIKRKYKKDPVFKLAKLIRCRVVSIIKNQKTSTRIIEYVGCSLEQLKSHLENMFLDGMTWDNHGQYGWHIDHIIPLSSFDLTQEEQRKVAFHYTNLQPLWWIDNIKKSNKMPNKDDRCLR